MINAFATCAAKSLLLSIGVIVFAINMLHIYASVNYAIIGSDNGMSLFWRKPIIWTIDGLLSTNGQYKKNRFNAQMPVM